MATSPLSVFSTLQTIVVVIYVLYCLCLPSKKNFMMQNVEADKPSTDKTDFDAIIVPTEDSPCLPGVDPDFCNENLNTGEIIDGKIVVTEIAPVRCVSDKCGRKGIGIQCRLYLALVLVTL